MATVPCMVFFLCETPCIIVGRFLIGMVPLPSPTCAHSIDIHYQYFGFIFDYLSFLLLNIFYRPLFLIQWLFFFTAVFGVCFCHKSPILIFLFLLFFQVFSFSFVILFFVFGFVFVFCFKSSAPLCAIIGTLCTPWPASYSIVVFAILYERLLVL